MIKFSNKEVAEQFECLVDVDRKVHKAGVFSGNLSDINLEMAKALNDPGNVLIKLKETTEVKPTVETAPKPDPEAPKEPKPVVSKEKPKP